MRQLLPTVTGYTATYANIGETGNKGVDINLTTVNIKHHDLTWTTTANAAWQKEHISALPNGNDIVNGWFLDYPISLIYGYKAVGLWQASDKTEMQAFNANGGSFTVGSVRVADLNGDHKIDANNDRAIIGWTSPRWIVGMTNVVTYKDFDFSIFIYGRLNYLYNTGGEGEAARGVQRTIDYYTENNTDAYYQKPIFNSGNAPVDPYYTALGYMKASFIKIRNISLGYNFNNLLASKSISGLRAYFQVQNPGMLYHNIKHLDMDVVGPTWNRGFTLGINASF